MFQTTEGGTMLVYNFVSFHWSLKLWFNLFNIILAVLPHLNNFRKLDLITKGYLGFSYFKKSTYILLHQIHTVQHRSRCPTEKNLR